MNKVSKFLLSILFCLFTNAWALDISNSVDTGDIEAYEMEIHWAVVEENLDELDALIKKGSDVNVVLSECIKCGREGLFETLIDKYKVNVNNHLSEYKDTLLHLVAELGHTKEVEVLLNAKANVNAIDKFGLSPLFYAVCTPDLNIQIIKLLLKSGADTNVQFQNGMTVLFFVVAFNNLEATKLLVEHGADLNHKDIFGRTALHYALKCCCDLAIIKYLLESGADANATDSELMTPLHYATKYYDLAILSRLDRMGGITKFKSLDVDSKNVLPKPLFNHVQALHSWLGCVDYSVLHEAFCYNLEFVRALIARGANVNAQNKYGVTPIMYVLGLNAFYGEREIVKDGEKYIETYRERDLAELLLKAGAKGSAQLLCNFGIDISLLKPEQVISEEVNFGMPCGDFFN